MAIAVAVIFSAAAVGRDLTPQPDAARPHVVMLLTDQQRGDAFAAAGAGDVKTPAMDRLARAGVMFTRAFAATPQCSPSRAALLTGRHPHRTGVMGNTVEGAAARPAPVPAGMSGALDPSIPTIGRLFAGAGYHTAYFGKWHLGGTPGDYGFETHDATIDDETLAGRVLAFLQKRATDRPLLLVVSWLNPHDVYGARSAPAPPPEVVASVAVPGNLADDLRTKPLPQRLFLQQDQGRPFVGADREVWRRYRAFYNSLVEKVDREIGVVLDALPRNRVTIFSSDHGDLSGSHGLPFKGPAMYEELVRVPLAISWPEKIRSGRSEALVSLIDVLPTLCDLTGVRAPEGVDGLSLRQVLEGRSQRVRDMVFGEYYGKQSWRVPIRMVRTSQWKYVRYLEYGEELYDLEADPGELRNLAGEPRAAAERARLARAMDEWIRRTADPFPQLTATDRSGNLVTNAPSR